MTERDLGSLLERASEHVPEVDFAEGAWAAAVAGQARRRRLAMGAVAAVAAAGLAVTAVQLGGSTTPRPTPATSSATRTGSGTLSDGTPYAVMPMEGTEAQLPAFDVGLPPVIDVRGRAAQSYAGPPRSVVAVFLRPDGAVFHPVLVSADGSEVVLDKVSLQWTFDAGGNATSPLGPHAVGGGGRYVVFPQPDRVVRLDTRTGDTVAYAVPSRHVEWAGWTSSGNVIVARDAGHAWTIDTAQARRSAVPVVGGYEGRYRITAADSPATSMDLSTYDGAQPVGRVSVRAPMSGVWGETVGTQESAATGAFFDQNVTAPEIRLGNGPIYQGLVAVDAPGSSARVLLAPENPDGQTGRFKGCCTVLGWADATTVLFQSVGTHGRWILAWNVRTGTVYQVSRLVTGAPDDPVTAIALAVGTRS